MKINMNETAKVIITKRGYQRLADNHNSIMRYMGKKDKDVDAGHFEKKADAQGYTEMQLWYMFDQFGGLGMGIDQFINIDIVINAE